MNRLFPSGRALVREKPTRPEALLLYGGGKPAPSLIAGFPQDPATWPAQVAAFKASSDASGTDPGGAAPMDAHHLMEWFRENLSQLLQDRLDRELAPEAADMEAPGDDISEDIRASKPHLPWTRK